MNIHDIVLKVFIFVLLSVLLTNIIACTKRISIPVQSPLIEKERLLHVELSSGKKVKVKEPRFKEGFLFGKTPIYETRPGPEKEIKISLEEIKSIEVERYDGTKTLISLTVIPLAVGAFFYILIQSAGAGRGLN